MIDIYQFLTLTNIIKSYNLSRVLLKIIIIVKVYA